MFVVTGLTNMNTGVCMSVYDTNSNCYRRPIPKNSHFQTDQLEDVRLFSTIEFEYDRRYICVLAPHTEDYPVNITYNQQIEVVGNLNVREQSNFLNNICDPSVSQIFGYDGGEFALKWINKYRCVHFVNPDTGQRSLGTVKVRDAEFYIDDYNSIRVSFTDITKSYYEHVKYVGIDQKEFGNNKTAFINNINKQIERHNDLFIRLSLSRPFQPNGWDSPVCFLQVSSVHTYN